ncbi:MAG: hypothetical protein WD230_09450, partial [Cucumibacter sp.]
MTRQEQNQAFLRTSFLYGGNAGYIEKLYASYKADSGSVDVSWRSFFEKLPDGPEDAGKGAEGPSWGR